MRSNNAYIGFIYDGDAICAFAAEAPNGFEALAYLPLAISVESMALAQLTADKLNETFEAAEILLVED